VLNDIKKYIAPAYLTNLILFSIVLAALAYFLLPSSINIAVSVTIAAAAAVFIIFFISVRKKETAAIIKTINSIRNNTLASPDQVVLGKDLKDIENEIRLMFGKMLEDIGYLKKLERMRTEFLANVSHELKTPIFTIQGYLETLLNGAINDDAVNKKFLEKANLHTLSLSNLVNDLIDISMIESGEMRMSFRYFKINDFLGDVVHEMSPLAAEKNLELIFIPGRENLKLLGDKIRLKQVMLNLITNAVKYTDTGKIEVLISEKNDSADIIVRDTGIGIPESDIDRIFERFYRIDKARSREEGGTGLGLAIVKHIVEAHGSKIKVKSRVKEGSEFSFELKK